MSVRHPDFQAATLETTWGSVLIEAGRQGVLTCRLPRARAKPPVFRVRRTRLPRHATPVLQKAVAYACALLEGRKPGRCPALDSSWDSSATDFRRAIWAAMRQVPRGKTATYAELARQAGASGASRAAGGACGANPLPLFVPCHRVVAAGGKLGGFSSGTAWKILLLTGEGVKL